MIKFESYVSFVVMVEFVKFIKDVNVKIDEVVVGRQRLQDFVDKNDVFEVVDNIFVIQEVYGGCELVLV